MSPAATSGTDLLEVLDPATGERIGEIPAGSADAVDAAVAAARAAQPGWARTDAAARGAVLKAAARRLRRRAGEVAELQSREGGKPAPDSLGGVEAGIGAIEQYAELGPVHRGRALAGGWQATDVMVFEPRGVCALLVPWNDPIAIACGQIAACVATGNTVVYKPSEKTPLSATLLAEVLDLPAGVLEVVHGDARAGRPLAAHPGVDLVIHTGSVETGREIAQACARRLAKALLELGGKDAMIVDAGVDPEWAAEQCATGTFANAGQLCTSVERVYVHEAVAEPFLAALETRARAWEIGPLIDAGRRECVHRHVQGAVAAGAVVRCGGEVPDGPGFHYPPTVLVVPDDETPLMREETFGPVAPVRLVGTFDEALALAADSAYGLAATVLTPSQAHAQRAARELGVGTVKINSVFGGAPGGAAEPGPGSGLGFGYGPELLDEVTRTKVVHHGVGPGTD